MDKEMGSFLKWVKKYVVVSLVIVLVLLVAAFIWMKKATAGELDMRFHQTTCYTWEGGLGAQGSFTKCEPQVVVVQLPPKEVIKVVEVKVPTPIVMEKECPPPPKPKPKTYKPPMKCERWVPVAPK